MNLPNAVKAMVEQEKVVDYLLNRAHPHGASKARFFGLFGFTLENWEALAAALREHGQKHEVTLSKETSFGPRYEVEGALTSPDGRHPRVRTVCADGRRGACAAAYYGVSCRRIMIREHDCIVLTQDLPSEHLRAGDVGTVVHIHRDGAAYEVEFVTLTGQTVAVVTVLPSQLRPVGRRDITHARELAPA